MMDKSIIKLMYSNHTRSHSVASATRSWSFGLLGSLLMVAATVTMSGCGTPEPPEIDTTIQEEIAAEDETVADVESEL